MIPNSKEKKDCDVVIKTTFLMIPFGGIQKDFPQTMKILSKFFLDIVFPCSHLLYFIDYY